MRCGRRSTLRPRRSDTAMDHLNERRSPATVALVALAFVAILLAVVALAYFKLSDVGHANLGTRVINVRVYNHKWQADLFRPLARIESMFVGREIETASK